MKQVLVKRDMQKKLLKRAIKPLARFIFPVLSAVLSPFFAFIARTGIGSNVCMKFGFLPVPLHYYQPIVDANALSEELWHRTHEMPGIDFNIEKQLEFLKEVGRRFGKECSWPEFPPTDSRQSYYSLNPSFGFSSGCLLHSVARWSKPSRVVEVGAGMSTLITANALLLNRKKGEGVCEFVAIDPYPRQVICQGVLGLSRLIETRVEDVPVAEFESLQEGDILFIDSSHVVRTGGDVNYLYLDILPRLKPGVIVHIHDIYLPYEYPRELLTGDKRYFWTEQYLLQSFLIQNPCYEVILGGYYLQRDHSQVFASSFPAFDSSKHRLTSSFYIRRL